MFGLFSTGSNTCETGKGPSTTIQVGLLGLQGLSIDPLLGS